MKEKLSVIIPAKDEANSVGELIARVKSSLSGYNFEVVVVDDGSKDGTKRIAENSGAIAISHTKTLGKGAAMKSGALAATGDILIFLDGDGAHNPEDIPKVIAPVLQNRADLIIGSRNFRGSRTFGSYLPRRITNKLASLVTSIIISFFLPLAASFKCPMKWIRVEDAECGFKAISKEKWCQLNLVSQGFEIESEIIYEAVKNRQTIHNAPISCNWDSKVSRLSILRDGLKTLRLLFSKLIHDMSERQSVQ
ncbi:MAG: glycosyltransferase family 2 protein, partial [Dehalococcoidia bacterium]